MQRFQAVWCSVAILPLAMVLRAGDESIPQTNRPANFSGAAGLFTLQVRASPTTVRVEEPVKLTVKIVSEKPGPWKYPPLREKLKLFPANLEQDFFVEPLPEEDRFLPEEKAWEFSWRLLPRSVAVAQIPEAEFVYYRTTGPQDFAVAAGAQTIKLTVAPRPATVLTGPNPARERLEQIAEGDHLRAQDPSVALWWTLVLAGLVMPPLGCWAFYFAWRQGFPEAAERLRRRRSHALKTALADLRRLGAGPAPDAIRAVIVDYLRSHVQLQPREPTPMEIRQALTSQGLSAQVVDQTTALVTACDARRFGLDISQAELSPPVAEVLQDLEIALCAPRS